MTDNTPVTPEEAEAREAFLTLWLYRIPEHRIDQFQSDLDAYRDAIRRSDKERIAALEAGIREALIETNHYRAASAGTTDNGHTSPGLRANNILRALLAEAPDAPRTCGTVMGGAPDDPGGTLRVCGKTLPCPDHPDTSKEA